MDVDKTIELINGLKDIPAMPHVIVRVLKLLYEDKAGASELADVVRCDQALCSKFLSLINSAYYGFGKQITSINMAISLLGLAKTKNIIVAVAMSPLLSFEGAKSIWHHSLIVAAGCERLAEQYKIINPDDAFVMGFLHDIGKVVLNLIDSESYKKFLKVKRPPDLAVLAEREKFGTDHSSTGAFLAVRWQLPEVIKNAIRFHHYPLKAKDIVVPAIVNIVNNMVEDTFKEEMYDSELAEMIKLYIPDVMKEREEILSRGNLLIQSIS